MRRSPLGLLAGALLALPGIASAHSLLLEAAPAPGAALAGAPPRVTLRFNSRVEKPLSRVVIVDSRGERRALAPVGDGPPDVLAAPLPPLPPDTYRLEWRVLSADGHVVSGAYAFRVVR